MSSSVALLNRIDRAAPVTAKLRGEISPNVQPAWLTDVVAALVHRERGTAKAIADALAVKPRAVYAAADRHDASALRAYWIPTICRETKSFALLDALEAQVGRVAFELPRLAAHDDEMLQELARTVTKFGEFVSENGAALEDGRLEAHEVRTVIKTIDAMIAGLCEYKALFLAKAEQDGAR